MTGQAIASSQHIEVDDEDEGIVDHDPGQRDDAHTGHDDAEGHLKDHQTEKDTRD